MIKLIISNIRDRFLSCIILAIVLALTLFTAVSPTKKVAEIIAEEGFYRRTGLESLYYFSTGGRDVREVCESVRDSVNLIGTGYNYMLTSDGFARLYPVDSGFFENLDFSFKRKAREFTSDKGYPAVVCKSLGSTYRMGETYKEHVRGANFTNVVIEFTVVGILSSDYGYFPAGSGLSQSDDFVYFIADDKTKGTSNTGEVFFTADSLESAKESINKVLGEQFEVISYGEGYNAVRTVTLETNGVSIILAVTSFLLSLCMMISHSMLSAASRQRKYSILFTCGSTRKKLLVIHILTDLIPTLAAVIAAALLVLADVLPNRQMAAIRGMTLSGIFTVIAEAALIFTVAEIITACAVLKSYKINLADER